MDNENQQHNQQQPTSPLQQSGQLITPNSVANNQPARSTFVPPNTSPDNTPNFNHPSDTHPVYATADQQSPALPTQQPVNNQPRKSKLPVLTGLIVLFLLLVAGGAYAYYLTQHKTVTTTKSYTGKLSNKDGSASGSITAPVTTTVNCGSENCFAIYFQNCNLATLTATSPIANVKYQIYGKKGTGCSMLFEYTSNPNSAWANQPMTCNFDNSKSLDDSVSLVINDLISKKNTYACTGPLVNILQNQ
jgi:hypothetical protein